MGKLDIPTVYVKKTQASGKHVLVLLGSPKIWWREK